MRRTVQLIDSAKGDHKWVLSWARRIQDVLGIETDISKRVASSLKLRMAPQKEEPRASAPPASPQGPSFCRFCGSRVVPGVAFCGHCGRRIVGSAPPNSSGS